IGQTITDNDLIVSSVLSGNRNFEGRVHPMVKANWLASPPLVVAFALAGTTRIDMNSEPLGHDAQNRPAYLRDIWPSRAEVGVAGTVGVARSTPGSPAQAAPNWARRWRRSRDGCSAPVTRMSSRATNPGSPSP